MANLDISYLLDTLVTILFGVMMYGGVIFLAYGVVELFKAFTSNDSDPRMLSKGVGFVIGGIVMIAIKSVVMAVVGADPTRIVYTQ